MAALGSLSSPIHLHLSSAFRSPSRLPKRFPVWHVPLWRDGFLLGSPGCSLGPSALGDIKAGGHFISDIANDMWKRSIVKTLERTFPHQSLTISKHDMEGFEERTMDRRKRLNEGHPWLSAFANLWGHWLLFPSPFYGDLPVLFRKLTPAQELWHGTNPFTCLKRGQGQSWRGSREKLAICMFSHDRLVNGTKARGVFGGESLPMKAALLLFPLPVGLTPAC